MKAILHRIKQIEKQIITPARAGTESNRELTPAEFLNECERRVLSPEAFLEPDYFELDCSPEEFETRIVQHEGAAALREWKELKARTDRIQADIDPEWKAEVYRLYHGQGAMVTLNLKSY